MENELEKFINLIKDEKLRAVCAELLTDERFSYWPAAKGHHHAYDGGLRTHTLEMIRYALKAAESFDWVDTDVVIGAGLWHDYCKIFEYVKVNEEEWDYNRDFGRKIGHISGGAAEFLHRARNGGVNEGTIDKIVHCILSHHGPIKEWGSPVAPQTIEAMLLHQADMLSAHFGHSK